MREQNESHPSWVRGLKQFIVVRMKAGGESHPSWVRGLKRIFQIQAPRTRLRRTLHGCVD